MYGRRGGEVIRQTGGEGRSLSSAHTWEWDGFMKTHGKPSAFDPQIRRTATDSLETVARSIGYSIVEDYLSSEVGHGYTVITAPLRRDEVPSERALSEGVALLFSYISLSREERLKSGFYLIRVATSGYHFEGGTATVSFVNLEGETIYTLQAEISGFPEGDGIHEMPGLDELASPSRPVFGKICGKRKCFVWHREGFFRWKFGCTNKQTGAVVGCTS
jgi:hypothetical protein